MKKSFLAVAMITLTIGLVFYFFTIETFQQIEMLRMKWNRVSSVVTPEFHYFEKNNCSNSQSCQCALLLHGLGDFALTWLDMLSADKTKFAENIHFYAPNLPGALLTPRLKNLEDYNVQKLAKRVSDHFLPKCKSWLVVGNSYGGWLAVYIGLQNENVKGLLLLNPAGMNKDYSPITTYFLSPTSKGAKDFYLRLYAKPKNLPDFVFKQVAKRAKGQPVVEQMKSIKENDFLENHLGNIKVPVQYVWGDSDRVIPTEWSTTYRDLTPNSKLRIIENCGHVPQKECTEEVLLDFNELLTRI